MAAAILSMQLATAHRRATLCKPGLKMGGSFLPGLTELIWPSAFVVQSIHVVARLGLADILGPEPWTNDELAKATRVHAPSLKRVLRALTTVGVFAEDADGRLLHTGLSQTLRTDHPESVRAWALMLGAHFVWRPLGDLYESVRTGTSGFSRLSGERFFEWMKTHPEDGAVFNDAMTRGDCRRFSPHTTFLASNESSTWAAVMACSSPGSSRQSQRCVGRSTTCRMWSPVQRRSVPQRSRGAARLSEAISLNPCLPMATDTSSVASYTIGTTTLH